LAEDVNTGRICVKFVPLLLNEIVPPVCKELEDQTRKVLLFEDIVVLDVEIYLKDSERDSR
jgi:hypothetical protein